jgi:hypothetical protein
MEEGITSLAVADLTTIGARLRAQYLLQQANYTIELARTEGEPLTKLMSPGLLDKASKARDKVAQAFEDRTVKAADSKLATGSQNVAARAVRDWGRRAVARSMAAMRTGIILPDVMADAFNARTVPTLIAQAQRELGLLTEHAEAMDKVGAPTQPLIDEGRALLAALLAADGNQELTRAASLPGVVSDFYARKAELYIAIQMINDAGHELYAHDPQSSSRFNMSVLYRRHGAAAAEPTPAPTPPAPTPPAPAQDTKGTN